MGYFTCDAINKQAAGQPLKDTSFIDRMEVELKELSDKITKLSGFLGSTPCNNLPQIDQDLLYAQHDAMRAYRRILAIRLTRAIEKQVPHAKVDIDGEILGDGVRFAKPEENDPLPFNG